MAKELQEVSIQNFWKKFHVVKHPYSLQTVPTDFFFKRDSIQSRKIAIAQMFLWTVILSRRKYSSLMQPMRRLRHSKFDVSQ